MKNCLLTELVCLDMDSPESPCLNRSSFESHSDKNPSSPTSSCVLIDGAGSPSGSIDPHESPNQLYENSQSSPCLDAEFPGSPDHNLDSEANPCYYMESQNSPGSDISLGSPCLDVDPYSPQASQSKPHFVSSSEDEVDFMSSQFSTSSSGPADKEMKQLSKQMKKEEIQKKREEALKKKLEKQKCREEKAREREERMASQRSQREQKKQEILRRNKMKPGECLKFINVLVDETLYRTVLCIQAIQVFPHPVVTFKPTCQPVSNSITWSRIQDDGSEVGEDWVAVMWEGEQVAQAIASSTLVSQFKEIRNVVGRSKTVILLIFALELYHRKSQNARTYRKRKDEARANENDEQVPASKYLTREEVNLGLVELQVYTKVSHRTFEDSTGFAEILGHLTRAIAEAPLRNEREAVDRDMGWSARSYNKNCVRANKDLQGLDKLWLQHLNVFRHTNLDTVRAIAALYPSPTALIQAYEDCSSLREKEMLLQNLEVKRGSGDSAVQKRKIGRKLSRKFCQLFTQTDGSITLSSSSQ